MDAIEIYIQQLLAEAPPLDPEQAALIVRTFARTASEPRETADAA